jgi:hypothetical protein
MMDMEFLLRNVVGHNDTGLVKLREVTSVKWVHDLRCPAIREMILNIAVLTDL